MAEAALYKDADTIDVIAPTGGYTAGEVLQLCDGRAAYVCGLRSPAAGEGAALKTTGQVTLAKDNTKAVLAGGQLWWDRSAAKATPIRSADSFFIGCATKDAATTATTVIVDLNVKPRYQIELGAPECLVAAVAVKTAGTPAMTHDAQGYHQLLLTNNDEAQKIDLLSVDSVPVADGPIFEVRLNFAEKGDNAAVDIVAGLANGTHASDPDSITESAFFSVNGDAVDINCECDDGSANEVAATDSGKDLTEGTYVELWIDARDLTDLHYYIDGVEVLPATTFNISAATGPLKALVLVEKSGGTHVPCVQIDWLRVRSTDLAA